MADFTAGGIHSLPIVSRSTGNEEFDRRIRELVTDWGCTQTRPLIQELIVTALRVKPVVLPPPINSVGVRIESTCGLVKGFRFSPAWPSSV